MASAPPAVLRGGVSSAEGGGLSPRIKTRRNEKCFPENPYQDYLSAGRYQVNKPLSFQKAMLRLRVCLYNSEKQKKKVELQQTKEDSCKPAEKHVNESADLTLCILGLDKSLDEFVGGLRVQ